MTSEELGARLRSKRFTILYFSASWCAPCHRFTPILAEIYSEQKEELEIIFCAGCTEEERHLDYITTMPWPVFQWAGSPSAYGFNRAKVREAGHPQGWLAAKYGIQSVPAAVLLDAKTGRLLCADVKRQITLGVGDSETGEPDRKAYESSASLLAEWSKL